MYILIAHTVKRCIEILKIKRKARRRRRQNETLLSSSYRTTAAEKKELEGNTGGGEGFTFVSSRQPLCLSAAEVNNPRTPSCASRRPESGESYFIGRAGNGEPFAFLKFKSCENAPQVGKEERGEKKNSERKEDALVTVGGSTKSHEGYETTM